MGKTKVGFIQRIKCKMPFSFSHFWHKPVSLVRWLSASSKLIKCDSCGKMFAMNDDVRQILPWDEEFEKFYEMRDGIMGTPKAEKDNTAKRKRRRKRKKKRR